MKQAIHENIKHYRKEKGFTQENLAEAMGVSVGAVSKWESGASVPELPLILELADFFEISVDALLGFHAQDNSAKQIVTRIKTLARQKENDACLAEIDKALVKFPNHYEVVFQSASACHNIGTERRDPALLRRALALCEQALRLLPAANAGPNDETTLADCMAGIYFCLEENKKGLELLKAHNAGGVFDSEIGYIIATHQNPADEALPYLSDGLVHMLADLFNVCVGYANVYEKAGDLAAARQALTIAAQTSESFLTPGKPSYLDKICVILQAALAQGCAKQGDMAAAREALRKAKAMALAFDAAPDYTATHIRFYKKDAPPAYSSDDFGQTAMAGIERVVADGAQESPALLPLWEDVKHAGD